jgi:LPS sulfotransferase NodH
MPETKKRGVMLSSVEPRLGEMIGFCRQNPRLVAKLGRKLWYFYFKAAFPDHWLKGHTEYNKFIIAGRSRTGSNLLRGSLMAHSRIVVFGDIFRRDNAVQWGIPFYPQFAESLALFEREPIEFLEAKVFGEFPRLVSAVGFKILYPLERQDKEILLTHLSDYNTLKVIHIKRRNILKAHLSHRRVEHSRWSNITGMDESKDQIFHLDYEECLNAFQMTREWENKYDALFEGHPKIEVGYESLISDYKGEMRRIQEFLGVNYEVVRPLTHKQFKRPISQTISNYSELKSKFQNTEWAEFFGE